MVYYAVVENWYGNSDSLHDDLKARKPVIGPDHWCQSSTEVPCSPLLCIKLAELVNSVLVLAYPMGKTHYCQYSLRFNLESHMMTLCQVSAKGQIPEMRLTSISDVKRARVIL